MNKLPTTTQIDDNIACCLVNGIPFLSKGNFLNSIYNYNEGSNFSLFIKERTLQGSNENARIIYIFSYNQNLLDNVGVTFPLSEYVPNSKSGEYVT